MSLKVWGRITVFLCVKSLDSSLAFPRALINVSCVAGGGEHTVGAGVGCE